MKSRNNDSSVKMTDNLKVYQDGKERQLMDWMYEKGEKIYKDVGDKTWRVPPIKFNNQILCKEQKIKELENQQTNVRIDAPILGQLAATDKETNRVENFVSNAFEKLSNDIVKTEPGSAMFMISNFAYDNYLNKLSHFVMDLQNEGEVNQPKNVNMTVKPQNKGGLIENGNPVVRLPKDVANRGELDMLILHRKAGVILVQAKAVGYNFHNNLANFDKGSAIHKAVNKAVDQLVRDRKVIMYIMEDLGLKDKQITSIVTLPNLPRSVLMQEIQPEFKVKLENEFHLDLDNNFLCEEDFKTDSNGCHKILTKWWNEILLPSAKGIDLNTMKQIAYRTVGLLSTVSVWAYAQPRIEVRNLNEAAWETGNKYTQVVLSPQQVGILRQEDQYLYLWGPAGSGKTLLLSLKGRQWLRQDLNVAILNTRLGSRGRTVGQVIETTINKSEGLKKNAIRIDLDLMDSVEALMAIVNDHVKGQTFNFLLDEIAWVKETEELLMLMKKTYPRSSIWCAGMLNECQPEGFEPSELEVILRCPPWVQRVLRIVDNREERRELYKLDSAKAGLPTDGMKPVFIIHTKHGDPSIEPFDCAICAREMANLFIMDLNMTKRGDVDISSQQGQLQTTTQECDLIDTKTTQGITEKTTIAQQLGSSTEGDSGCDLRNDCEEDSYHSNTDSPAVKNKDRNGNMKATKRNKKKKSSNSFHNSHPKDTENVIASNKEGHEEITNKTTDSNGQNFVTRPATNNNNPKKTQTKSYTQKSGEKSKQSQLSTDVSTLSGKTKNKEKLPTTNYDQIMPGKGEKISNDKENQQNKESNKPKIFGNQNDIKPGGQASKKKQTSIKSLTDDIKYAHLNFRDAVLPATVPRSWHHFNKRGNWAISREALAQEMVLLGSRAFCQELFNCGVPLKVEEAMVMKAEGKELENHFVFCPIGAVHGLEYKLVVSIPSACALPKYIEISEGIRNGTMEPMVKMKRTQFGTDQVIRKHEIDIEEKNLSRNSNVKIDKIRISTHVAEEGAPYDLLYEPLSKDDIESVSGLNIKNSETEAASSTPYIPPTYTDEEIQKIRNELCGQCDDNNRCVCQYFNHDELAAMHRLDVWSKAYILMCASRCTSLLVLVLP